MAEERHAWAQYEYEARHRVDRIDRGLGLGFDLWPKGLKGRLEQWRNTPGVLRKALLVAVWTLEISFYVLVGACILAVVMAAAVFVAAIYAVLCLLLGGDLS